MGKVTEMLIATAWCGLPRYGAELLAAVRKRLGVEMPVVATRPHVPIKGMDEVLQNDLYWISESGHTSWKSLGLKVPDVLFQTGWRYPYFVPLGDEVRAKGGAVVGLFDNNWKGTGRQLLGGLWFRMFLRRKYSAVIVPGKSGRRLARYFGIPETHVISGLYGASKSTFNYTVPLSNRPKQILFVGQLIDRKGVRELVAAFTRFRKEYPEWRLRVMGTGELLPLVSNVDGIDIAPFCQPHEVSVAMNSARALILPSREEHWGLVVHEAALCGCPLITSRYVGASEDLATTANALILDSVAPASIHSALCRFASISDEQLSRMSSESIRLADNFGLERCAGAFETSLNLLKQRR
jgi:glycosyltransferase involved in cell wall biosynthesis